MNTRTYYHVIASESKQSPKKIRLATWLGIAAVGAGVTERGF
jgi:hypothetical protein